ncbi:MAG: DUF1080 domain-containing protein [Verrucomicrobia bacterium]|nr:DUF1080 domain-containing protein [Verrucomicrobiota bacterium]
MSPRSLLPLWAAIFSSVLASPLAMAADAPATTAPAAAAATPSAKVELFNGKDLTGWTSFLKGSTPAAETWSVKDGLLACTGKPNGFLRTEKSYKQYKFTVEWRFTKPGNTGVVVHMTAPDAIWPKSIECQGMNKNQGDFYFWSGATSKEGVAMKAKDGTIRGYRIGKQLDAEKPAGEWNTFTTICDKDTVTILVNGKEVNKATGTNLSEGFIGLQSEGGAFEVKRCTLEPL